MSDKKTLDVQELSVNFEDSKSNSKVIDAQHKTIIMLSKQIEKLKEENEHLKQLVEDGVQIVNLDPNGLDPEVIIAETQLQRLKDLSMRQNLTYEECKKVEVYQKILSTSITRKKVKEDNKEDAGSLSTDDLMAALSLKQ